MKLSVIIPVLNEAEHLPATLAGLNIPEIEIIVVDGGSQDQSADIARDHGCTLLNSAPGRAQQMNLGASVSGGNSLLFLHGDTIMPPGFHNLIDTCLADPTVVLGCFSLKIDDPRPSLVFISKLASLRSKLLNLPYGDQALFMRKSDFMEAGGFPITPIMEDYIFVRAMARKGKIRTLPQPVITSGRRWQNVGVLRTTVVNQCIIMSYLAGVSPKTLARWYGRLKGLER